MSNTIKKEDFGKVPEFYHATFSCYVEDIFKFGLGARQGKNYEDSKEGVVCLALDPDVAESYCETAETPPEGCEEIVVIKVLAKEPLFDWSLLDFDTNLLESNISRDSFEYNGIIPPALLKIINMKQTRSIKFEFKRIIKETPKAWLLEMNVGNKLWFPKFYCQLSNNLVIVPFWLVDRIVSEGSEDTNWYNTAQRQELPFQN